MITYNVGFINDIGKKRTVNQDKVFMRSRVVDETGYALYAVADGMGGYTDGDIAAQLCINALSLWWEHTIANPPEPAQAKVSLYNLFRKLNDQVLGLSKEKGQSMGSTLSCVYLIDNYYIIAHAGDSRIYKLYGNNVEQLTSDHSWVAKQVDAGIMTQYEADIHPRRSILINSIGNGNNFFVDISSGILEDHSLLLICSDGLYKYINAGTLPAYFGLPQQGLDNILKKIYNSPADDNISGIAVSVGMETAL